MKTNTAGKLAVLLLAGMVLSQPVPAQETELTAQTEALAETEMSAETETLQETESAAESTGKGQVASASEMADVEEVLEDWMVPIEGSMVEDGTYDVRVNCSSSMFSIEKAVLHVQDGVMTADLTMGGTGYLYVYPGSAEEAAAAPEEDLIAYTENEEEQHVFTIPVKALDDVTKCAAFSKRKEKWYDRSLVFASTSLPSDALKGRELTTAASLGLEDGEYLVDAVLAGGSGRTTIESPAHLTVENGSMTLQVVFSSKNYDYMIVDGEVYQPVNEEGNSTFLIPAAGFDCQLPVIGDTIAMSTPHEIEYTISLDSGTLVPSESN